MKILRYAQISLHARLKFLYLYQGYSTARTLLSILRLSEAIARLRWSDEVSALLHISCWSKAFFAKVAQSDVDESLRLIKMSKV